MIDLNDTALPRIPSKCRVTLLALGDVGSTLLTGLRLMGGDVIDSIGICDVRPGVSDRWEFELNQIQSPDGAALPPVDIIAPEQLFDGDVFLFCASRMIPDTSVTAGDVRMAQYGLNRELVSIYARMARDRRYRGLFCVVSDPVDPLCRAVLRESGLSPAQVRGFGLGVMHDDDALSRELTEKVAHANLEMRKLGYKPYVAPALSSGALSLLALLRGQWHYSSVYDGQVFMGCRNRLTPAGIETEPLTLPPALQKRIDDTRAKLNAIE